MKLIAATALAALTLTGLTAPAAAQRTTTHRVHGPVRLLPHHRTKTCQTKWVAHHKVRKCNYH